MCVGMCPTQPPGPLVERGHFIWRPHPCEPFIKKLFPRFVLSLSPHTKQQRGSQIILPSGHKLLTHLLLPPSSLSLVDTGEKRLSDSGRQAEAEWRGGRDQLLRCCLADNLHEKKSSLGTRKAPAFVQKKHLRPFSCSGGVNPPRTTPPPVVVLRFSPLSVLCLCYSSFHEFSLKHFQEKASPKWKKKKCFFQWHIKWAVKNNDETALWP